MFLIHFLKVLPLSLLGHGTARAEIGRSGHAFLLLLCHTEDVRGKMDQSAGQGQ